MLGCSLASGLGVRDQSVGRIAAKTLEADAVLFKAKAKARIDHAFAHLPKVEAFRPDLVILSSGNVEAFVHPHRIFERALERFAPKGWHGDIGLDPRPYFSADPEKARTQKRESAAKVFLKNVLIRPFGGYTHMSAADYESHLSRLLDELTEKGTAVVLVGPSPVSRYYFPYSRRNLRRLEEVQRAAVVGRPRVRFVSTFDVVDRRTELQADRAHPTVAGHEALAAAVVDLLSVEVGVEVGTSADVGA
ncbi:SGNH/GDSL hydrolase family protein [Pseudonocardia pini]|uniref:SGNH/GDSL hydrolase family protein n=1 Tax=Pseudonocardia pini TaxID=2758030 RepID=UPI0015EFE31D|nr:hypothetical protein [Pseudonocardia pini]